MKSWTFEYNPSPNDKALNGKMKCHQDAKWSKTMVIALFGALSKGENKMKTVGKKSWLLDNNNDPVFKAEGIWEFLTTKSNIAVPEQLHYSPDWPIVTSSIVFQAHYSEPSNSFSRLGSY